MPARKITTRRRTEKRLDVSSLSSAIVETVNSEAFQSDAVEAIQDTTLTSEDVAAELIVAIRLKLDKHIKLIREREKIADPDYREIYEVIEDWSEKLNGSYEHLIVLRKLQAAYQKLENTRPRSRNKGRDRTNYAVLFDKHPLPKTAPSKLTGREAKMVKDLISYANECLNGNGMSGIEDAIAIYEMIDLVREGAIADLAIRAFVHDADDYELQQLVKNYLRDVTKKKAKKAKKAKKSRR